MRGETTRRGTEAAPSLKLKTPTAGQVTATRQVRSVIEQETGKSIPMHASPKGAHFTLGEQVPHVVIDVAESATQNSAGKPVTVPQKSTIVVTGDTTGRSVHPVFELSKRLTTAQTSEVERLYKFVAGVDATTFQTSNELHIDTGQKRLKHGSLDVAEIIVRRVGDEAGVTVSNHTVKSGPTE